MAVTWATIQSYFTDMDVDHMKKVSAHWPTVLDLHDRGKAVLYYATQVHAAVASGRMPIGEPPLDPANGSGFPGLVEKSKPDCKSYCVTLAAAFRV